MSSILTRRIKDKLRYAAFVGSAGLLAMIVGLIISRPPQDPSSGALRPGGYFVFGGGFVTANALIYGLSVVKTNESHLGRAVDYYNNAHPDDPIQLQFSTKVNF